MATAVWLWLDARRLAEWRAPRRGHLCAAACVGEGGVRARVGPCLRVCLDAGALLDLAPLERGASGKLAEASAPFANPEWGRRAGPPR